MVKSTPKAARPPIGRLETMAEAAERLRCSAKTIRRRVADGTIHGYRRAGSRAIRVSAREVDEKLLVEIPTVERSA